MGQRTKIPCVIQKKYCSWSGCLSICMGIIYNNFSHIHNYRINSYLKMNDKKMLFLSIFYMHAEI